MAKEYERHKRDLEIAVIRKPPSPYLEIFMGEIVPYSAIYDEAPECLPALERLMLDGRIQSQPDPDNEADLLLWMPAAVKARANGHIKGSDRREDGKRA